MRSKAIFLALLAFAFGAQAEPVSSKTVKAAARAWVQRGHGPFRSLAGVTVEEVTEFRTTDDVPFFAAKIAGGGTVFLSGDTAISPIIAFTPASTDFSSIDPKSPLWALLNRDISVRARALNPEGPYLFAANQASRTSVNRREWAELEAEGADGSPYVANGGLLYGVAYAQELRTEPEEVRIPMLVKSQWSQGDVGSSPCYNYYTPNNYVCGCVATALGQVLLYNHGSEDIGCRGLEFPLAEVKPNEHTISVDGVPRKATLAGGTYAWDDMPLVPASGATDTQRQNIGKLLSDCGIAVDMSYTEEASGSNLAKQRKALLADFGYKQAVLYGSAETDFDGTETDVLKNVMFANFDAGNAVLLGIPGHAIVADGYGYEGETPFVHLNFGWGGSCDFWYNLPDMTAAGDEYTVINEMNYNIFPDKGSMTADDAYGTVAILSGRVLDDDGLPVDGMTVTITKVDGGEVVAEPVTDERGIWSAVLEAGIYNLRTITDDGQWLAEETDVDVNPPSATGVGNSWGHDLQLVHPSVRLVVDGTVTDPYSTLDRAIAAARVAAETATDPIGIEVLDVTQLKNPAEIDFDCVFVATNDDPYASAIVRPYEETCLVVTNGATLALSNIVFAESTEVPVEVREGGHVSVAGTVDFGIAYDQTALVTADADGFMLSGPIDPGFTLDCAVAQTEGLYFGFADCDFETASNAAARIVCANDKLGELRGEAVEEGGAIRLRWVDDATRVPLADAVGYYVDAADGTNTRARIDRLFAKFEEALADGTVGAARELVILRPGALSRSLTVGGDVTIRGEGNPVVDCSAMSGFTVTNGTLTVSGITFSGYANANGLFLVEGGKLVLDGVGILDAKGTKANSGAVVVRDGAEAELIGGTVLAGCSASGSKLSVSKRKDCCGGGVTVDAGGSLMLGDCTITNCWAYNNGGGISAAKGSRVVLTNGVAVVRDNTSGSSTSLKADDLYVAGTGGTVIGTVGQPGEGSAVGVRYGVTDGVGNGVGDVFARILADVSDTNLCAEAFFNDTSDDLSAIADGVDLRWQDRPTQIGSSTDGSGMRVAVYNVEEGTTLYYRHVEPAFAEITGESIVLLRTNDTFDADIEVKTNVVLTTDCGKTSVLAGIERVGNCSIVVGEGGSLTVEYAGIYGYLFDEEAEDPVFECCTVPLIRVDRGSLTLDWGSEVAFAFGYGSIFANAVTVRNGGTFAMRNDALIYCCGNFYDRSSVECGFGGGLNVHDGTVYLEGGEIADCFAAVGGGAFIGGKSTVYVSGNVCITNNTTLDTAVMNNLAVSDNSQLVLADELTGAIGYVEGDQADTKVFGSVSAGFSGDVQASAHRFTHDVTGDIGMAVSDGSETLLVWGSAIDADGRYADDYELVAGDPYELPADPAAESFTYDGTEKTAIVDGIGYRVVSGNTGVDAGGYEAILVNRPGFVWVDGTTGEKTLPWSISKAPCVISFKDGKFAYDGYEHSLAIESDQLAELTVTYSDNNLRRQPGTNVVTATINTNVFSSGNWKLDSYPTNLTAKLIVLPAGVPGDDPTPPEPPQPHWEIVTTNPTAIAFKSIDRVTDTEWKLVVTNRVRYCNYRLIWTDDLTKGFVSTGDWEHVVHEDCAVWTTNVITTGGAWFWRAEGKDGTNMVLKVEE